MDTPEKKENATASESASSQCSASNGGASGNTGKTPDGRKGRPENLRPPWKPGESGNPAGRPKLRPISDRYDSLAEMPLPEARRLELGLREGATNADALAKRIFDAAIDGRLPAAREVREAIEGKSNRRTEPMGPREVTIHVLYEDPFPKPARVPNDASSVPNASQDDEKGSK